MTKGPPREAVENELVTVTYSDSLSARPRHSSDMKSLPRYLLPALALLVGIAIGHRTGGMSHENADHNLTDRDASSVRAGSTRSAVRAARKSSGPVTDLQRLRDQIKRANPEQIPALVYRVLEIADPNERKIALFEAIRGATPEECQSIMDQFVGITRNTGRIHDGIWASALFETGKIGGTTMLDSWKVRGKTGSHKELCESIYGVASQDPRGALAWINRDENADLPDREKLLGFVIAGVALTNIPEATRMMNELPMEQRHECLGHFMWNSIQNEGIDNALGWAITERQQVLESDPGYAQAIENDLFDRIYTSAEWTGGAPLMAERIARIHQSSPIPHVRLNNLAQRLHGSDGLTFIDHLTKNHVVAADDPEVTVRAIELIAKRSPDVAQNWLRQNPDSPIRDLVEYSVNGPP